MAPRLGRNGGAMTNQPTRHLPAATEDIAALADKAIALVRTWLADSRDIAPDTSAQQLADVLRDPHGLEFTVGFVDGVIRPEDTRVAARRMGELVPLLPKFLPPQLKAAFRVGAAVAPVLPGVVVPVARRVLRHMVRHLIVDDLPTACAAREGRRRDTARAGRTTRAAHAVRGGARRACRAGARSRGGGTCRAGIRTAWSHAGTDRRDPDGGAGHPAAGARPACRAVARASRRGCRGAARRGTVRAERPDVRPCRRGAVPGSHPCAHTDPRPRAAGQRPDAVGVTAGRPGARAARAG